MAELTMPRLSDTMQEGTLARWLKQPGERVERGEIIAEIETDKATMELEAYDAGVLERVLVQEGQTVPIGEVIAIVGSGEGVPTEAPAPAVTPGPPPAERPAAQATGDIPAPAPEPSAAQPGTTASPAAETAARAEPAAEAEPDGQVKASPMARAIARERGIDLRTVQGSGPGGRVIRADVEAAAVGGPPATLAEPAQPRPTPPPAPAPAPAPRFAPEDVEEVPLSNIRRVVARRMVESVQSAPHFFLTTVVDATRLVALRRELNDNLAEAGDETKLTLNDLIIKACATALRANPDVNVAWAGDRILRHRRIHIGIAVALEGGLIVPVIRDADQKSVGQISREARALAQKARAGKLSPDEYSGGTFTISNLGMFGIEQFSAVINTPEAAILAVGAATPEPVVREGQVVVREIMRLTLSVDHRSLDGATGAKFLQYLRGVLEAPMRLVV